VTLGFFPANLMGQSTTYFGRLGVGRLVEDRTEFGRMKIRQIINVQPTRHDAGTW